MFYLSTNGGGNCLAFPDTCMTPGVLAGAPGPLPYPNSGMFSQASGSSCSKKVTIENKKPCLASKTEISSTSGDEAGNSPGGVVSSKFKGKAHCSSSPSSTKVEIEGSKAFSILGITGHNKGGTDNMPAGVQISPSQTKVSTLPA